MIGSGRRTSLHPRAKARTGELCAVSVAVIDRPVATWMHEHLGYQRFGWFVANYHGHLLRFGPFSLMAGPSEALQPLSALAFAVLAIAAYAALWRFRKVLAMAAMPRARRRSAKGWISIVSPFNGSSRTHECSRASGWVVRDLPACFPEHSSGSPPPSCMSACQLPFG
jgi:hypothetical protein